MKMIYKVALTGGPCGGKTTSIEKIKQEFTEKGFNVLVVPEAVTLLINMGIRPIGEEALSPYDFQKLVLDLEENLESMALETAKKSSKRTIILCDRGKMDAKAYIDKKGFKALLNSYEKTEEDLMNDYDLVIHLRTVALGKEEFYTLENNEARSESVEEAREKDILTLNCWLGHRNLKIIGNETGFDEKIDKVVNEIYNLVDKPYPIQKQNKYLVSSIDIDEISKLSQVNKFEIEQYIEKYTFYDGDKKEIIYRKTTCDNEESYKVIVKFDTEINNERITRQHMINESAYYFHIPQNEKPIKKTRYCFEYMNEYYKLDIFNDGMMILEVEETSKSKNIVIPDFIKVEKDITFDKEYRNSSIYNRLNSKEKVKQLV